MIAIERMTSSEIIARIKAHNPGIRKDADIRVMTGKADSVEVMEKAGRRELTVVANTARIDEDSEVVVPEGGELGYFGENRSVFFDHCYDDASFIGKVKRGYPKMQNGLWVVRFGVRRSDRGDQLLKDAEDFGVSVSIGFDAIEHAPPTDDEDAKYGGGKSFRSIVRKWRWAELSVTWMPCNVDARAAHPQDFAPKKRGTLTPFGLISAPGVADS